MKGSEIHKIFEIELSRLVAHPLNANEMERGAMEKLKRHIGKTGRYEPLIVRKHPTMAGCYELINGHHRKEVLAELGYTHAACLVWELNDVQAMMLLATVNRLAGEDSPGKRLALLEALSAEVGLEEMVAGMPEEEGVLRKLLENSAMPVMAEGPAVGEMLEAFTVFMTSEEKRRVVGRLREVDEDLGRALKCLVLSA